MNKYLFYFDDDTFVWVDDYVDALIIAIYLDKEVATWCFT